MFWEYPFGLHILPSWSWVNPTPQLQSLDQQKCHGSFLASRGGSSFKTQLLCLRVHREIERFGKWSIAPAAQKSTHVEMVIRDSKFIAVTKLLFLPTFIFNNFRKSTPQTTTKAISPTVLDLGCKSLRIDKPLSSLWCIQKLQCLYQPLST